MSYILALAGAGLIAIVTGMFRLSKRADDHAEQCDVDCQTHRTRTVIDTVRRQQAQRRSINGHLRISQELRPWRRAQTVDEDLEELGISG